MHINVTKIRVRYGETDQMGVVYHGNYALYLEMGRVEWFRKLGIPYKEIEENGMALPIVSMQLNYRKPIRYDELINVKTQLKGKPNVKVEFEYEITNEQGEILTTAETILVFVDIKSSRPVRAPKYILDAFGFDS